MTTQTTAQHTAPAMTSLIAAARDLASDDGENPEYDRALVELVCQFAPDREDDTRAWVEARVLKSADAGR